MTENTLHDTFPGLSIENPRGGDHGPLSSWKYLDCYLPSAACGQETASVHYKVLLDWVHSGATLVRTRRSSLAFLYPLLLKYPTS